MRINILATLLLLSGGFTSLAQTLESPQLNAAITSIDTPFELKLSSEKQSLTGMHYRFDLYHSGYPIYGEQAVVHVLKNGDTRVIHLPEIAIGKTESNLQTTPLIEGLGEEFQLDTVWKFENNRLVLAERLQIYDNGRFFETFNSSDKWETPIDRSAYNRAANDTDIDGHVFLPDPLTTANQVYGGAYVDNNDADSPELNNERVSIASRGTFEDNVFKLKNEYVRIQEHSLPDVPPVTSADGSFDYTRSESGFEDYNTMFHITSIGEYVHSLGFTGILDEPMPADCHALNGADQSNFVSFPSPRLNFGEGGVDDAEDADVIVHEYGHAIMYDIAPETNFGTQRQSIDEAIGDYIAASYSYSLSQNHWFKVFTWDGHNEYWGGRLANEFRIYPDGLINNVHADASIFSSPLMAIEFMTSRAVTTSVLLESAFNYFSNMSMTDAADLFLQADSNLYNGAHWVDACIIFKERGLVEGCNGLSSGGSANVEKTHIYPTVAPKESELRITGNGEHLVEVFDLNGRLVSSGQMTLPVSIRLDAGYFIVRIDGKAESTAKVIRL